MSQTYINVVKLYKISNEIHIIKLWECINLGQISGDSRGQLFSLDLLFALIPLVLVLGIIASDMDNITYLIEDTVFQGSTDRVATDAVNALLETSGSPINWEQTGAPNAVGLAKYDQGSGGPVEGTISPSKLAALNESNLQSLVGPEYGFYMNLSTIDTGTQLKQLGTLNSSAANIVRLERVARASKLEYVSQLEGEIKYTGGTRTYVAPIFNTSYSYNQTYNYWIVMLNNTGFTTSSVWINNNQINLSSSSINTPYLINSTFLNLNSSSPSKSYNNTVTLNATGSFGSEMNFYIVQAPKDVSAAGINYNTVYPKECKFIFYLWVK